MSYKWLGLSTCCYYMIRTNYWHWQDYGWKYTSTKTIIWIVHRQVQFKQGSGSLLLLVIHTFLSFPSFSVYVCLSQHAFVYIAIYNCHAICSRMTNINAINGIHDVPPMTSVSIMAESTWLLAIPSSGYIFCVVYVRNEIKWKRCIICCLGQVDLCLHQVTSSLDALCCLFGRNEGIKKVKYLLHHDDICVSDLPTSLGILKGN